MDPVKVLLVEDDEDDYVLIRDLLAEIGETKYALDWAVSYDEGLRRIASQHYDVWLLDYRLGARTGLDLLRETVQQGYAVPVLLLTGQGDREVDLQAAQLGASDYLSKQELKLCPTLLERAIRYTIGIKRQEQERLQFLLAHEAQAKAEAANRAKDEVLGMVSHELRAPLNTIRVWVGVLQQGPSVVDPALAARAMTGIERGVKQQTRILEDLLDITSIGQGTLRIEKRLVDLAAVIEGAVSTVRPAAEAKSITLQVTRDPALDRLPGDPGRLEQIVVNLLSNSIQFTPQGGRIKIGLERVADRAGPQAQITVADTGQGISSELLPFVFERYRQAKSARGAGGLGIGLAIVRSLVELHGGSVRAESPGDGLGATFTIRLPLPETDSRGEA
ncbi:MAG: ATP-binding protein [Gammaproteobacteria bacterium]